MRVTFSLQALEDLDKISSYIENRLKNPIAAHNTVIKILQRTNLLKNFTDLGKVLEINNDFIKDYRFLNTNNNYLIIYKITGKEVIVVRILYSRSDYKKLLNI